MNRSYLYNIIAITVIISMYSCNNTGNEANKYAITQAYNQPNNQADVLIQADAKSGTKEIEPYWNFCVGAGRANEGLRANWQEQLNTSIEECGFRYIRFHGLFHDDMFVYKIEDGKEVYNWQYIDELYDRLLEMGIRPFVELSFFPCDMTDGKGTVFWWEACNTPPEDLSKWKRLVTRFVEHCVDRYGVEEVKKWYFEVWNEPNLGYFFNGDLNDYLELYKTSAEAVKSVNKDFKIGGPATSNFIISKEDEKRLKEKGKITDLTLEDLANAQFEGVLIKEFLAFCEDENVPVDFISTHPYPTHFPLDIDGPAYDFSRPVNSVHTDLLWLNNVVANSAFPDIEIHLTEWSSCPSPRDHTHDYLQEATYIVKQNLDCIGMVNSMSYWTFTDVFEESGAGDEIFHGGFGLINFQDIVKPAFHAYRFLNQLGNIEIHREDGAVITKSSRDNKVSMMVYNYPDEYPMAIQMSKNSREIAEETLNTGSNKTFSIHLTNLPKNTVFLVETLDKEHGFALKDWQRMGYPNPPNIEQTKELRKKGWDTKKEYIKSTNQGDLIWSSSVTPWAVISILQL
ncbi:MAG: glycoside hydrolase [Bacteroidetes bacterium]|nr:glycoside hydrolase [Bacteroidota bacterium]